MLADEQSVSMKKSKSNKTHEEELAITPTKLVKEASTPIIL